MSQPVTTAPASPPALGSGELMPGAPGSVVEFQYELSPDLVTLTEERPSEAEAIRTVRTHIIARHLDDGRRGLAVCAATAHVGCSFTAANLAVSLSQVGISTLLIDGDMREPAIQNFIRPNLSTAGLKQCLAAPDRPPSDFIHAEILPQLSVMYSGGYAGNAQELLGSEPFRRLVERCLRDFEFTIIDTPPANKVADALRIGSMIGYAVIVARTNVSLADHLSKLAAQLEEDGAAVVGTVLNEV